MKINFQTLAAALMCALLAGCTGVPSTAASISTSEALMDLGTAMSQLR